MRRDDVCEVLKKIPEVDLTKVVLVLRYNAAITIDVLARIEEDYLVVRGRENGTNDEGRAFFVPFDDILFIRLDRIVTLGEMKGWYGEKMAEGTEKTELPTSASEAKAAEKKTTAAPYSTTTPAPAPAMDPAGIAKQNLLARIRAVRSGAGAPAQNS
jgi:hypothetical protein